MLLRQAIFLKTAIELNLYRRHEFYVKLGVLIDTSMFY